MIDQPCCAIFFAPVRTNEKLPADALGHADAHAAQICYKSTNDFDMQVALHYTRQSFKLA